MDEFYKSNVFGYSIEPTSDKGLHRYIDFYSMMPQHIRNRPDISNIIMMFQDYLNDGYRKIPEPVNIYSYKPKKLTSCNTNGDLTTYSEVARPLNHTPVMHKRRINSALDYSRYGEDPIEEYNKERDIETWAIEDEKLSEYIDKYNDYLIGNTPELYSYYNEPKIYKNVFSFYNKIQNVAEAYGEENALDGVFLFLSTKNKQESIVLDESALTLTQLKSLIPYSVSLPPLTFNYYACDLDTFKTDFENLNNPNIVFKVESRKIPYYQGISEDIDRGESPYFAKETYSTFDDLDLPTIYNKSFRVTFKHATGDRLSSTDWMDDVLNHIGDMGSYSLRVEPQNVLDIGYFSSFDVPCIASSVEVIQRFQHPEVFYKEYGWQNEYRHDKKGASLAEKVHRLAYSKDASVFDYEYLSLISQHFGYSIETDEDEINESTYYKTKEDKEKVLRNLIKNMPEYNRMKGTDSGIEMVLLSFGLVGRIVTLFTRGDSKTDGYSEFIDSRIVSGVPEDYVDLHPEILDEIPSTTDDTTREQIITEKMSNEFRNNSLLAGTSVYDWYASPHFRIEFDMLKEYLNIARGTEMFSTIAKSIKRVKPINTVFQGFYAKLSAEYGRLFINPPRGILRGKQILFSGESCEFTDDWSEQCALELRYETTYIMHDVG